MWFLVLQVSIGVVGHCHGMRHWVKSLGLENSLEEKLATALQCSCLGNLMDRGGARQVTIHGVTKLDTTKYPPSKSRLAVVILYLSISVSENFVLLKT